ncbi:perlucin-like protein [Saccostrea cucullata]|uniref:perlucin-like protein n=1 Tax=Saccostrea cuccullata TaxID=36930 RepID=UPI002ED60BC0
MDLFFTSFFIILSHFVHSLALDNCPPNLNKSDLYTYGDFCLKVHYGNYDWDDARHQCLQEGGDLVQIRDSGMQHFLQRILSGQRSEEDGFWIGASDNESESHWKWVSGDPRMSYSNWEPGQGPSQSGFFLASGTIEDCALMRVDSGFRWHDYDCSSIFYHYSSICQYDTVHKTTTSSTYETVGDIIG